MLAALCGAATAHPLEDALAITDPAVLAELEKPGTYSAPALAFSDFILDRVGRQACLRRSPDGSAGCRRNPFTMDQLKDVRDTVLADIAERRKAMGRTEDFQINTKFLTAPESSAVLVGIVNRMDRLPATRFNDKGFVDARETDCGEIRLLYRFKYDLGGGKTSKLPVTMNLVLHARPLGSPLSCADIARRWLRLADRLNGPMSLDQKVAIIRAHDSPIALLDPQQIHRLELNIQAFRIPASVRQDFGSRAEYLIRVYRFEGGMFRASFLESQIDREAILKEPEMRKCLVAMLSDPDMIIDLDRGLINIPDSVDAAPAHLRDSTACRKVPRTKRFLARRVFTLSPGGLSLSGNLPFYGRAGPEAVMTDAEIEQALLGFTLRRPRYKKVSIAGPESFRARLNDSSCSGCHQVRAIAGFHFVGADDDAAARSNAIFIPGSPHFYGDLARRAYYLRRIADHDGGNATIMSEIVFHRSIAERPDGGLPAEVASFVRERLQGTQLAGGWGAACALDTGPGGEAERKLHARWTCQEGLACKPLFDSAHHDGFGTCVTKGAFADLARMKDGSWRRGRDAQSDWPMIGDAMEYGLVGTERFGEDRFHRLYPNAENTAPFDVALLGPPPCVTRDGRKVCNEYKTSPQQSYGSSGGFPSGMLRMKHCVGLPEEATCGLVAGEGFNKCLETGGRPILDCMLNYTTYGALRTCDIENPCRDDYICVSPMLGFHSEPSMETFRAALAEFTRDRAAAIDPARHSEDLKSEVPPDESWASRAHKGTCIPPYFVFQFRVDRHPRR